MEPLKGGQLAKPPKEALRILNSTKMKKDPVEWALQFLWNKKEVSVVLSGMGSLKMLEENCMYADRSGINTLSPEDNKLLSNIVDIYKREILVPCTACHYCMPCPFGVNIPENFAIINAANSKANNVVDSVMKWMTIRKYRKLAKSEDTVNKKNPNGDASLCTACGECVPKCPQNIKIPEELNKVNKVFGKKRKIKEVFI